MCDSDLEKRITDEIYYLHAVWNIRCELVRDSHRIEVLNASSGFVWRIIHDSLIDQVILGIGRLNDKPSFGIGKDTASLRTLFSKLEVLDRRADLEHMIEDELPNLDKVKRYRDKRVAHSDLNLEDTVFLQVEDIEDALAAIRLMMNEYRRRTNKNPMCFQSVDAENGEHLIRTIWAGLKVQGFCDEIWSAQTDSDQLFDRIKQLRIDISDV